MEGEVPLERERNASRTTRPLNPLLGSVVSVIVVFVHSRELVRLCYGMVYMYLRMYMCVGELYNNCVPGNVRKFEETENQVGRKQRM